MSGKRVIPNAVPHLAGNEWRYVKECLDTNWVSSVGPFVDRFEREVAARLGVPHAIATVNGSAALHVALLAAGVHVDDEVLLPRSRLSPRPTPSRTAARIRLHGSEPRAWGLDADKVADFSRASA